MCGCGAGRLRSARGARTWRNAAHEFWGQDIRVLTVFFVPALRIPKLEVSEAARHANGEILGNYKG